MYKAVKYPGSNRLQGIFPDCYSTVIGLHDKGNPAKKKKKKKSDNPLFQNTMYTRYMQMHVCNVIFVKFKPSISAMFWKSENISLKPIYEFPITSNPFRIQNLCGLSHHLV